MDVLTTVVGLCAIVLTVLTILDRVQKEPDAQFVSNWEKFATSGHAYGVPNARVTLIQFSDYQCPACRKLNAVLDTLIQESAADLRVVVRHFPLKHIHPFAERAAIAAECAGEQSRFEQYHRLLYRNQDSIPTDAFVRWASEAGVVDVAKFQGCLERQVTTHRRLHDDSVAAADLQINSTPTMLINGRVIVGAPDGPRLRAIIDSVRVESAGKWFGR